MGKVQWQSVSHLTERHPRTSCSNLGRSCMLSGLLQIKPQDSSLSKTTDPPYFLFCTAIFLCLKALFVVCLHFRLCVNSVLYSQYTPVFGCLRVCVCVCTCMRACVYELRVISTDKTLRFINTLIIIVIPTGSTAHQWISTVCINHEFTLYLNTIHKDSLCCWLWNKPGRGMTDTACGVSPQQLVQSKQH